MENLGGRFSRACCESTRGNGFKLKEDQFRLKIFFTARVMKHSNWLPREVCMPILENIQEQFGWVSEQPDLTGDVPAPYRGVGLGKL